MSTKVALTYEQIAVSLASETATLQQMLQRSRSDIVEIGKRLLAVQARFKHGDDFRRWVSEYLGLSHGTADNFMNVARLVQNAPNLANLDLSVQYELGSKGTPQQVLDAVASGQIEPNLPAIREAKRELKEARGSGNSGSYGTTTLKQLLSHIIPYVRESGLDQVYDADKEDELIEAFAEVIDKEVKPGLFSKKKRPATLKALAAFSYALSEAATAILQEDEQKQAK